MPQPRALEPVYWLIVRQDTDWQEALTIGLGDGKEALPVFSWAEEARMFLWLGGFEEGGWAVRESTAGGLVSMLEGERNAKVGFVALDPVPEMLTPMFGTMISLVTLGRQGFIDRHTAKEETPGW